MDPPPRRTCRLAQHVHERRDIVLGEALALVDLLHRERRRADGLELGRAGTTLCEQPGQLLAHGDLDLSPALHASIVGPETPELGAGVAGNHSASICAARIAALRGLFR